MGGTRMAHCLNERGMTLLEIIIAALLGVVVAGGMMLAFTSAQKTSAGAVGVVEASDFAQQTLERFRNKIACDDPDWFNASDCTVNFGGLPSVWTNDGLPASPGALSVIGQGATRQYRVTQADCDGDGTQGDCLQVESKVAWTPRQ